MPDVFTGVIYRLYMRQRDLRVDLACCACVQLTRCAGAMLGLRPRVRLSPSGFVAIGAHAER